MSKHTSPGLGLMRRGKGMKKWQTHTDIQTKKLDSSGLGWDSETPASQKFSIYYKQSTHR